MLQKTMRAFLLLNLCAALFVVLGSLTVKAQTTDNLDDLKKQVSSLLSQQKYIDALPILEKLAKAEPGNADTHFYLGFALLAQSANTPDKAARKPLRLRARSEFSKAKELGRDEPLVKGLIESIPPDGGESGGFSANEQANELMEKGEAMFSQGKLDEALAAYQKAFALDPKIYEAALFSGDVYKEKKNYEQAESWYQKAIAVNPNRETAYRYSATPLMLQKKFDQARERYVEAYIVEPYSRFSVSGLSQWADVTKTNLGHPKIDIPTDVKYNEKGDVVINLDANTLLNSGKDEGSSSWIVYGATRSNWRKEKFAKTFPNEKTYRRSLREETEAIRSVLILAEADTKNKKAQNLTPALAKLKKLNDEGLLEAYILLARPDDGIAQDYAEYLMQNRDKLRRYMMDYVLTGGGK